jgi:hypothetical protein
VSPVAELDPKVLSNVAPVFPRIRSGLCHLHLLLCGGDPSQPIWNLIPPVLSSAPSARWAPESPGAKSSRPYCASSSASAGMVCRQLLLIDSFRHERRGDAWTETLNSRLHSARTLLPVWGFMTAIYSCWDARPLPVLLSSANDRTAQPCPTPATLFTAGSLC